MYNKGLVTDIEDIPKDNEEALKGWICYMCNDVLVEVMSTGKAVGKPTMCKCCKEKEDESNKYNLGQVFRHFKGGWYQILRYVIHAESGEQLVLYKEYDYKNPGDVGVLYVRSIDSFKSKVDIDRPDNITKQEDRFLWVKLD